MFPRAGLEDQLLGRVILTEKREMEMERINLVTGITENRRKIQNLESNLLLKLTTVQVGLRAHHRKLYCIIIIYLYNRGCLCGQFL